MPSFDRPISPSIRLFAQERRISISSMPLLASASTLAAARSRLVAATSTSTPRAPLRSMPSSYGQATAMSAALLARSGPPATAVPTSVFVEHGDEARRRTEPQPWAVRLSGRGLTTI